MATVFHRVAMKPRRPTYFGVREPAAGGQYVFGRPGNPVSTFVTFELLARRLIERMAGIEPEWADRHDAARRRDLRARSIVLSEPSTTFASR